MYKDEPVRVDLHPGVLAVTYFINVLTSTIFPQENNLICRLAHKSATEHPVKRNVLPTLKLAWEGNFFRSVQISFTNYVCLLFLPAPW